MLFIRTAGFFIFSYTFYLLLSNTGVLDSNYSGVHRVVHHSENLSIKYYEQKCYIKFAFSGQHWTRLSMEKCKKNQFLGCLIKTSISVLNSNNESAKKPTVYDLLFLIAIYYPKNQNKRPSDMRN